ncbi:MAG: hypothetical protein ABFD50_22250 [Smithella sp.]
MIPYTEEKYIKIRGKLQKGCGQASHTICRQKQFFKKYIKDIDIYYDGTINLKMEKPLIISNPDIFTEPIEWTKGTKEEFSFLKIKLEIEAFFQNQTYNGFIYIAHKSPHYIDPFYHEILVPYVYGSNLICMGSLKKILAKFSTKYKNYTVIIDKPIKEENGFLIV